MSWRRGKLKQVSLQSLQPVKGQIVEAEHQTARYLLVDAAGCIRACIRSMPDSRDAARSSAHQDFGPRLWESTVGIDCMCV
mmetsp:Transcript_5860/g.10165  ORF Transcript_5860/g.10165 Transcript_5860/m.10165 type:complete len:81 (-) Transcript_5860:3076-3318(-)